jgi:hypothetical protein
MGSSDPPGTTYIPGLRENLHGLFTVNLGVYVPEVARSHGGGKAKSWVQEYHCCVRARLGDLDKDGPSWWPAAATDDLIAEVGDRLLELGIPFLARYESRVRILAEWSGRSENMGASAPPRIVMAIILAEQGRLDDARRLLSAQARNAEASHPRHAAYVRALAIKLGLEAG